MRTTRTGATTPMQDVIEFALLSFASLFTMINPIGIIPVFIAMTQGLERAVIRQTAYKAVITAFLILVGFAITGQFIFRFFGISVESLRVVGGVIFFFIGFEMLQARMSRTKMDDETTPEYTSDIAITPLAVPMICGPGAIATVIVLMGDAAEFGENMVPAQMAVFVIITIVMMINIVSLLSGEQIMRFLGDSGNKVLMRLMGLILMALAVEFFFGGLTPIVREMLMIGG